jgi:hypothetical protein
MKDLIFTIIFILLLLTAIASAYAQEEWYEVAEASGVLYDTSISREVSNNLCVAGQPTRRDGFASIETNISKGTSRETGALSTASGMRDTVCGGSGTRPSGR